jgi:hypothetical protein
MFINTNTTHQQWNDWSDKDIILLSKWSDVQLFSFCVWKKIWRRFSANHIVINKKCYWFNWRKMLVSTTKVVVQIQRHDVVTLLNYVWSKHWCSPSPRYEFIAENNEVISRAFNIVYSQTSGFSCTPLPSSLPCNSIDQCLVTSSWNDIVVVPQATPLQHHDPTTNCLRMTICFNLDTICG